MDKREPVLEVRCSEPDGDVVRVVREGRLSFERLRFLYEKLSQFDVLFNDYTEGDFRAFIDLFIRSDKHGLPVPTGLIWDVDDVGIFYLTDMQIPESAVAHFVFWDKRLRGREELCREMLRWVFLYLGFHRIRVEVPLYAHHTMSFVERIGFVKEGRAREAVKYKGDWFDVNLYSILEEDLNGSED